MTRVALLLGDTNSTPGATQLAGTCWYLAAALDHLSDVTVHATSPSPPGPDDLRAADYTPEVIDAVDRVLSIADWTSCRIEQSAQRIKHLDVDHLVVGISRSDSGDAGLRSADARNDVYADFSTERSGASKLAALVNTIITADEPLDLAATSAVLANLNARSVGHPAAVFGTGPSFDLVPWANYGDHLTILCNSAVGNQDVLEVVQPELLVAADPVFHSSFGVYAARFRSELVSALDATDAWFVCPTRDVLLYRHYLPEAAAARLLPMPLVTRDTFNLDLISDLEVKSTPNVLTLLLLPLALTLSDHVTIGGCDGKAESSDYFWGHAQTAQFTTELEATKTPFKGFFAIDYDEYYGQHLDDLSALILQSNQQSKTVVNATPSHIPVLRSITDHRALHVGAAFHAEPGPTVLGPFSPEQEVVVDEINALFDALAVRWPTGVHFDDDAATGAVRRRYLRDFPPPVEVEQAPASVRMATEGGSPTITVTSPEADHRAVTICLSWHSTVEVGKPRCLHSVTVDGPTELSNDGPLHSSSIILPSSVEAGLLIHAVESRALHSIRPVA